jgi:hypothetical protein
MAQTAFSISNVTSSVSAKEYFPSGPSPAFFQQLSVDFQIRNSGPNHVAGLVVTTNNWVSSQVVAAQFNSFGDDFEFWSATFPQGGGDLPSEPFTFEFVVFCDDFGGVESVPRIWNTNGGDVFQVHAT